MSTDNLPCFRCGEDFRADADTVLHQEKIDGEQRRIHRACVFRGEVKGPGRIRMDKNIAHLVDTKCCICEQDFTPEELAEQPKDDSFNTEPLIDADQKTALTRVDRLMEGPLRRVHRRCIGLFWLRTKSDEHRASRHPIGEGVLAGDDMRIEWKVFDIHPVSQKQECQIKVFFRDGEGKSFSIRGGFDYDPIKLVRTEQQGESEWKKHLVYMATILVEGAQHDATVAAKRD